jgi:hypothetical protein
MPFDLIYIPENAVQGHIPCLYKKAEKETSRTMIVLHGKGNDLGTSALHKKMHLFCGNLGVNVLAVEYAGYGMNFDGGVSTATAIRRQMDAVV